MLPLFVCLPDNFVNGKEKKSEENEREGRDRLALSPSRFSLSLSACHIAGNDDGGVIRGEVRHLEQWDDIPSDSFVLFRSAFRMAYCDRANLTATELSYILKIYSGKTWAWWVNHIGRPTGETSALASPLVSPGTLIIGIVGFGGNLLCLLILCRRCKRSESLDS